MAKLSMDGGLKGVAPILQPTGAGAGDVLGRLRPYLIEGRSGSFVTKDVNGVPTPIQTPQKAILTRNQWLDLDVAVNAGVEESSPTTMFFINNGCRLFLDNAINKTMIEAFSPNMEGKGIDIRCLPLPLTTDKFTIDTDNFSAQPAYTAGLEVGRLTERTVLGIIQAFRYGGADIIGLGHSATVLSQSTPIHMRDFVMTARESFKGRNYVAPQVCIYPKRLERSIPPQEKLTWGMTAPKVFFVPTEELYDRAFLVTVSPDTVRIIKGPVLAIQQGDNEFAAVAILVPDLRSPSSLAFPTMVKGRVY